MVSLVLMSHGTVSLGQKYHGMVSLGWMMIMLTLHEEAGAGTKMDHR
jgi:hypothetical protein